MTNRVLARQAMGLPPKPKRGVRKSISNGGNVYKPMVLERTFDTSPDAAALESAIETATVMSPETVAEHKKQLHESVTALTSIQLEKQLSYLKDQIKVAEDEARNPAYKLTDRFRARPSIEAPDNPSGAANDNEMPAPEERIEKYEAQIRSLEAQQKQLEVRSKAPAVPTEAAPAKPAAANESLSAESAPDSIVLPISSARSPRAKKGPSMRAVVGGIAAAGVAMGAAAAESGHHHGADVAGQVSAEAHRSFDAITSFIQKNEGADKMFEKLQAQAKVMFPDTKNAPPIVKHLLAHSPHNLSIAYHFVSKDGRLSRFMHTGDMPEKADSLSINDQGQLVFHSAGKGDHVLIHETAHGKLSEPNLMKDSLHPSHHYHVNSVHTSAHYTPKHEAAPQAHQAEVQSQSSVEKLAVFKNSFGITIDPTSSHLYTVINGATQQKQLVLYGDTHKHLMEKLQEVARENPGVPIYFDSPEPTTYNGEPQPWVSMAVYDPQSGFTVSATPEPSMVGVKISPDSLTELIK
ncbi:MAG: hypothetical protein P4M11_01800 [Candidatus Pacebacteria bacterium]|nr:hypothetical protein [Candidatus Paceibacterota bacterium]